MNSERFDVFTCTLSSRRTVLGGLLAILTALISPVAQEEAAAHNPSRRCRKLKDAKRRRRCLRRARAHNRRHRQQRCRPVSPAVVCGERCGTAVNNCGQAVACPCPPGSTCLANGSCAEICLGVGQPGCPDGCLCPGPNLEGDTVCTVFLASCADIPLSCSSTAQCPFGTQCRTTGCSPNPNRCVPLCQA